MNLRSKLLPGVKEDWYMSTSDILRALGVSRRYRGHRCMILAVSLVLENEDRLYSVIQSIYYVIAQVFGCSWQTVERNIRTTIRRAWITNPDLLCSMAGYRLDGPPTASEFIEMIYSYVQRSET